MWKLAFILAITNSVLSADFNRLSQQNDQDIYPIDYNDEFHKDQWVKKPQNLYFKFEQIRKDQPPQVEQRNEDLGRYMYRKKVTTTESAPVEKHLNNDPLSLDDFSIVKADFSKVDYHRRYPEINTWYSHSTTLPPTPSTAKWETMEVEGVPQSQPQMWNMEQKSRHYESFVPSTSWVPQINEHRTPEAAIHSTSLPLYVPEVTLYPVVVTPAPAQDLQPVHENKRQQKSRHSTRGNTRFRPSDMIPKESTTSTTTMVSMHGAPMPQSSPVEAVAPMKSTVFNAAVSTRAPPPPVPTLSPWYDGFGK